MRFQYLGPVGRDHVRPVRRFTLITAAILLLTLPLQAQHSFQVWTRNYNNQRTGADTSEHVLNTSNVNGRQFGKLFMLPVDDQVYAGLLYASDVLVNGRKRNVLYVATVNNSLYAFDADAFGPPLWHENYNGIGRPTRNNEVGQNCHPYLDFIGNIGIVGTPVIGPNHTLYFVTRTVERGDTIQRLHAVDIATGKERPGSPREIQATVAANGEDSNNGVLTFNALTENQRPALAFADGTVYIGWASFCDTRPYHGWMMAYDATTLSQVGVFNASPNHRMSGIWMSGAGPAFDREGNLYVSTGNGSYDGSTEFGEALVKLAAKKLAPLDYFAPSNFNTLNEFDLDFGTQGPTMLPNTDYMVIGGKEGKIYLLDSRNLGAEQAGDTQIPQMAQVIDTSVRPLHSHHLHNAMVAWAGPQGDYVYVWGENDFLRVFKFDPQAKRVALPAVASAEILPPMGMPGGMMTLSSDGTKSGSGVLWASIQRAGDANQMTVPGNLYAFDAENLRLLWSSTAPGDDTLNFAKGSPPIVANGKVYVATISNFVSVYGLKETALPALNLALHKTATGSTPCEPSQNPAMAFNGSAQQGTGDKWCSSEHNAFLQVDLGHETEVGRFVVEHAGAGADDLLLNTRDFNIDLSTDGTHFQTALRVRGNIQSITTHDIKPMMARYVRLNVITPAQIAGAPANIYELQVFPPFQTFTPPPSKNVPQVMALAAKADPPGKTAPAPSDVAAPPSNAEVTASHLAMKVLKPGTGTERPEINDCAKVVFTSWTRDGSVFSTSTGESEVICLRTAILGVSEALKAMTAGEKRRLWVPADLTFREGQHHMGRPEEDEIPPHEDLTIDLELLSILKAPPTPADLYIAPFSATKTASGLAYEVLKPGTGSSHPTPNSTVKIQFSGWTSDGRLFESTAMNNHPALVRLASVMPGLREALTQMSAGEKVRVWIPAALAYGTKPANRFSPPGDLIYEIELLSIE